LISPRKRKITEFYEIGEVIGSGGFSEVRKGKNKRTNETVAIKTIEKRRHPEKIDNVRREILLMKKLNHKNIVCLEDVFEEEGEEGKIHMVLEYVSGGELFDHIIGRGNYSERDAAVVVRQIIEAVAYLHSKGIAHRDLKPENLLCTGPNHEIIKVADFGLSKEFSKDDGLETICGTPDYVAPEVLRAKPYTNAVDIWSIGVITYVLLCASPPFYGNEEKEVYMKILAADYKFFSPDWDTISDAAKEFITHLLVLLPSRRPTAVQCLEAPWLKCSEDKQLLSKTFSENMQKHTKQRRTNRAKRYN
jgi:calcium/calmodulin-dependent protein kinase I